MSKKLDTYIGKKFLYRGIGEVEVIDKVRKSITKVLVKETDRGRGYDERTDSYIGVKSPNGWIRGENKDFGREHEAHIRDLSELN